MGDELTMKISGQTPFQGPVDELRSNTWNDPVSEKFVPAPKRPVSITRIGRDRLVASSTE